MPPRQPPDDEQPHPPGDRHIHDGLGSKSLVDISELRGRHPDPAVADVQHDAAIGELFAGDHDPGVPGRERGRVLQELGHQMHEVVDHAAGDPGIGQPTQFDPFVLLDLRDPRAQHVENRNRLRPPAVRLLSGQHQEVLPVTTHTGSQVVQFEQAGQLLGVLLGVLQLVDETQLPLDQPLAAPRQVDEHRVDVTAKFGLLCCQPHCLTVYGVEGARDLADLVRGVHAGGLHRDVRVTAVGLVEPAHHLGEPPLGHVHRRLLQTPQRANHRPRDEQGDGQREDDHQQHDGEIAQGVQSGLVA